MTRDDFCKGGIGTGEAGGEARQWGREAAVWGLVSHASSSKKH